MFYITSLTSRILIVDIEDIENKLFKELSLLLAIFQTYIINIENVYLLCFINFVMIL